MRKIEVDGYAYWATFDAKVGDNVEVPGPFWRDPPGRTIGKVTALTSAYDGETKSAFRNLGSDLEMRQREKATIEVAIKTHKVEIKALNDRLKKLKAEA